MNKNKVQLIDDSELRLPDNDTRQISPEDVRLMVQDLIDSMPVFKTGGLLFENEVGYKNDYRPTSAGAFSSVDMIKGSEIFPFSEQIWITNIPNPDDGFYHKIKMTMGVDSTPQYEDLGPV